MKNSSNDIYINGEYFKNNPHWDITDAKWKVEIVFKLLQKNNIHPQEVMEIGCGAGGNLHELSKKDPGIKKLMGYDISPQAIALANKNSSDRITYFNEDLAAADNILTNLLLVIDVIEHVDDFYGFLRQLKMKSEHFIFHIPLDLSCRTVMKPQVLLQQRKSVGHIHYFSAATAAWALSDTGYEIVDRVYTKPVVDTERPRSIKRLVKFILRNISFAINKEWSVKKWGGYSIMILAK